MYPSGVDQGWTAIPAPGVAAGSGVDTPPGWEQSDTVTQRRIAALKSDPYFWSAMRGWDRQFKNAGYLAALSLGALGATIEFTVHNDMHMRWTSAPRDPATGEVVPDGRLPTDLDPKWSKPVYDFLGEFYSSHVNPVFWRLHGWIDDRIEDWFAAHEVAHPGEVDREIRDGFTWLKPGKWVRDQPPWAAPAPHHGHGHGHDDLDPEIMRQVIQILYADEEARLLSDGRRPAISRRTWFLT